MIIIIVDELKGRRISFLIILRSLTGKQRLTQRPQNYHRRHLLEKHVHLPNIKLLDLFRHVHPHRNTQKQRLRTHHQMQISLSSHNSPINMLISRPSLYWTVPSSDSDWDRQLSWEKKWGTNLSLLPANSEIIRFKRDTVTEPLICTERGRADLFVCQNKAISNSRNIRT